MSKKDFRVPQHHSKPKQQVVSGDIVYGKNPVFEVLRIGRRSVFEILTSAGPKPFEETELFALAKKKSVSIRYESAQFLDKLSHDGVHQGVLARVAPYPELSLSEVIQALSEKAIVLVLDCIQDPQNFGTLCRSALAFGVTTVIVPKDRAA